MPIVHFFVKGQWLPRLGEVPLLEKDFEKNPKWALTDQIVTELPTIVASAIDEVDGGKRMTPDLIVVVPQFFHPWAQNAPEWWIDIQHDDVGATETERQFRRHHITMGVGGWIALMVYGEETVPSFDVEYRPLQGTGVSFRDGMPFHYWGLPPTAEADSQ